MPNRVFVVGVGMTKFEKPGKRDWDYPQMGEIAINQALQDAGVPYEAVQQAFAGYCYGDSTCGQRVLYGVGMTGIPVYNVNNNCSTGSTALFMAKQIVAGGQADCVLAFGFEKMERGSLGSKFTDRTNPLDRHSQQMISNRGITRAPFAPQMFGNAGVEHMERYGTKAEHFAKIAEKNHKHSALNPRSQFRDVYTLQQILDSPKIFGPLTKLQCCPTSDGAAAAVLVSEDFVKRYGLQKKAIEIKGMSLVTDFDKSFGKSSIEMVGFSMSKEATRQALAEAHMNIDQVQAVELHDCFSANELVTYEAIGLCPEGQAGAMIDGADASGPLTAYTWGKGRYVVNPSGGLISKGHPLGATGLAQCAELTWQLRGEAGPRQVPNATAALQHNLGLGGAAVVTVYAKPGNLTGSVSGGVSSFGRPSFSSATAVKDEGAAAAAAAPAAAPGFKSDALFAGLTSRVAADSTLVKRVGVVYEFVVTSNGKQKNWAVDLKNGAGSVKAGSASSPDTTITIADQDILDLFSGKADPIQLFMGGKLKVSGDMGAAQKLSALTTAQAKM